MLKKSLLYLLIAVFSIGAFLNAVGMIVFQSSIGNTNSGRLWYFAFYYIIGVAFFAFTVFTRSIEKYRLAIVGFAAVGLAYCTGDLDVSIVTAQVTTGGLLAAMVLKAIGLFFIVFPLIAIILIVGSEKSSLVSQVCGPQLDSPIRMDPAGTLSNIAQSIDPSTRANNSTTGGNQNFGNNAVQQPKSTVRPSGEAEPVPVVVTVVPQ